MSTLFLVVVATLGSGGAGDELAKAIVDNGHKRVAIVPMVINRQGESEATIGRLGPRARLLSKEVYERLVELSQKGKYAGRYRVVPERVMMHALRTESFTVQDLGNPRKARDLARQTGADGFITMTFDEKENLSALRSRDLVFEDEKEESDDKSNSQTVKPASRIQKITAEITEDNGSASYAKTFEDATTLGKAAYQGQSFELRRWEGGKLVNLGLEMEGNEAFGAGPGWENEQLQHVKIDAPHPHVIADLPYDFKILVNGAIREPRELMAEQVIELNPGEEYEIVLKNGGEKDVLVALYVDGVSTVDKKLDDPHTLSASRHWLLKREDGERAIRGWYTFEIDEQGKRTRKSYYEKFRIVERGDSVAAQQGFEPNIGMITAIFYTLGMEGIPKADLGSRAIPPGDFGTGAGERVDEDVTLSKVKRGIMLAAVTYYYRTGDEIRSIEEGTSEDHLFNTTNLASNESESAKGEEENSLFNDAESGSKDTKVDGDPAKTPGGEEVELTIE